MITPTELDYIDINAYNIEAITIDIDDQIKKNHGVYNYEYAKLKTTYPQAVRNEIDSRHLPLQGRPDCRGVRSVYGCPSRIRLRSVNWPR